MNKETVLGVVRHALTFGGGFLSQHALATDNEVNAAISGIVAIVGLVWSVIKNKKNAAQLGKPVA